MQLSRSSLSHNIQLDDITRAVNFNNLISHSDRLKTQLNDAARSRQTLRLEKKFIQFNKSFENASDFAQARVLQELENEIQILNQKKRNIIAIEDSSLKQSRRTHRQEEKRLRTEAQIADKRLRRQEQIAEKETRRQQQTVTQSVSCTDISQSDYRNDASSNTLLTDFISNSPATPFIMTFTFSGAMIRSPERDKRKTSVLKSPSASSKSSESNNCEIIVVQPPIAEKQLAELSQKRRRKE